MESHIDLNIVFQHRLSQCTTSKYHRASAPETHAPVVHGLFIRNNTGRCNCTKKKIFVIIQPEDFSIENQLSLCFRTFCKNRKKWHFTKKFKLLLKLSNSDIIPPKPPQNHFFPRKTPTFSTH